MNNSFSLESPVSQEKPDDRLREREAKLVRLIEALGALDASKEWSTLKEELFDGALESIEGKIRIEADKAEILLPELYRLQGERKWAKKYSKLDTLADSYRVELANIRRTLIPPA